ncbi:MAG TPA: peptide chain release factor 2 [Candidatus Ventricola intestinavium]|nr:peptide chain release factor 2 [Candidatus Ventricola intestinavium]
MIELDLYRQQLAQIRESIVEAGESLNIAGLKEQLLELHETMNEPDFWNDLKRSTEITKKVRSAENKVEHWQKLGRRADDVEATMELAEEMDDKSLVDEAGEEIEKLKEELEELRLESLLRGDYDSHDCYVSLHAGAGGTEAQDWTLMLYRMYSRYCERHGFAIKPIDMLDGDEAGIKSVTFEVDGENAYGFLRSEKGVHRLVRISPFDANARRQTSFSSVDVSPILEDDDDEIEIDMKDVRVDTYHASGAGGQNVNKTSSAVRMTHYPTGIVVSSQTSRDQVHNRENCLRMLRARLLELREREREEKMADIKGEMKKIEWGSQIRSYVFHPYSMVKDHRTGYETSDVNGVMDGELDGFITAYLQMQ